MEGGIRGQREGVLAYAVEESGWLRTRYAIQVNGHTHTVDTTLIPLGDIHLRAHRITLGSDAQNVTAEEGSAALGYDAGAVPTLRAEQNWAFAECARNGVGIRPLEGYSSAPKIVAGSPNSVYGHNLLAVLTASPLNRQHDLICVVYAGAPADPTQIPQIERAGWEADGKFIAQVNGKIVTVPPLTENS